MTIRSFIEASRGLKSYKPSQVTEELAREGAKVNDLLKLNANENLFIPESLIRKIILDVVQRTDARLYPITERILLEKSIADYLDIEAGQVVVGSGGDQIIELVINYYMRSGDSMIAVTPTFSMYPRAAKQREIIWHGIDVDENFSLQRDEVLSAIEKDSKLLVICNPNNPTANQFERDKILSIIEKFPGLVLIDEAYAEYGEYSLVENVEGFDNLMILRTFSKAFGMAGMRLGYAITNTELAKVFNEKYQSPYPLSSITLKTGLEVLDRKNKVLSYVDGVKREREKLREELNELDEVKAFPSSTNFILFSTKRGYERVYQDLFDKGILVRKIGAVPGYSDTLRVTVPPNELCNRFTSTLREVMK